MSSELQNTDKIVTLIDECNNMGLVLVNPDVNNGDYMFTVNDENEIIYGLGAIKGLGEGPIESLIEARKESGPFTDLFDFCQRVDTRKVNKRAIEALIKSGAFDNLNEPRSVLFASISEAVQSAEQQQQNVNAGIVDMFGEVESEQAGDVYENFRSTPNWSGRERLKAEKETLGLFLTGHPIDEYEKDLTKFKCKRIKQLVADKKPQLVAGLILAVRYVKTKRGDKMAIITLDDKTARIDVTIFSKLLPDVEGKLGKDAVVFIRGEVEHDEYSGSLRMRGESVQNMSEIRSQGDKVLKIITHHDTWKSALKNELQQLMKPHGEGVRIALEYHNQEAEGIIAFSKALKIKPEDEIIEHLQRLFGEKNVTIQ